MTNTSVGRVGFSHETRYLSHATLAADEGSAIVSPVYWVALRPHMDSLQNSILMQLWKAVLSL
jgi:hypothetical protein